MNKQQIEEGLERLKEEWIKDYIAGCWESGGDADEAFPQINTPAFTKMLSIANQTEKKSDYAVVGKALVTGLRMYFTKCAELNTREPSIDDLYRDQRGLE